MKKRFAGLIRRPVGLWVCLCCMVAAAPALGADNLGADLDQAERIAERVSANKGLSALGTSPAPVGGA